MRDILGTCSWLCILVLLGAVGKAIEVEDKNEATIIRNSIKTAFRKMSGVEENVTKTTEVELVHEKEEQKGEVVKQKAEVTVHLEGRKREPVVALV